MQIKIEQQTNSLQPQTQTNFNQIKTYEKFSKSMNKVILSFTNQNLIINDRLKQMDIKKTQNSVNQKITHLSRFSGQRSLNTAGSYRINKKNDPLSQDSSIEKDNKSLSQVQIIQSPKRQGKLLIQYLVAQTTSQKALNTPKFFDQQSNDILIVNEQFFPKIVKSPSSLDLIQSDEEILQSDFIKTPVNNEFFSLQMSQAKMNIHQQYKGNEHLLQLNKDQILKQRQLQYQYVFSSPTASQQIAKSDIILAFKQQNDFKDDNEEIQIQSQRNIYQNHIVNERLTLFTTKNIEQVVIPKNVEKQPRTVTSYKFTKRNSLPIFHKTNSDSSSSTTHNTCKISCIKKPKEFLPHISARAWTIIDASNGKFIEGKCYSLIKEIASLTKIMTFYTCIRIIQLTCFDITKIQWKVSKQSVAVYGTSARLVEGMYINLRDLFYGLMLPSGNDAALALGEAFGTLFHLKKKNMLQDTIVYDREKLNQFAVRFKNKQNLFIKYMNHLVMEGQLVSTNFANVHGLMHRENHSTAYDIGKLCFLALKYDLFREVVSQKKYSCTVELKDGSEKLYTWENTNKLLGKDGFLGVKTGITDTAGPCLATLYEKKIKNHDYKLIIVILNCKNMEVRWEEAQKLLQWTLNNHTRWD